MKNMKKGGAIACLAVFAALLVLLGWYSATVITGTIGGTDDGLKLGLDLAGGVSITYEAVGDTPTHEQMEDTIYKLQQRIENDLGEETATTEASVYQVGDDRITVEIPGVSDANALLEELGTPGTIYFIAQTDADGNANYTNTGYGFMLNYPIETLIENGSVVLTGMDVESAAAGYNTNRTTGAQEPVVSLIMNREGTTKFAEATQKAFDAGESIGIYYDGEFISVPRVNAAITDGQAIIEGMTDYAEASSLASYIRIGGLDIELAELQSEVVGAQLGSDALATALLAAGIGLLLIILFMIFVYRVPGVAASLALVMYTAIILGILSAFDITLTLPGIAGIILSIGMAVDANAIIFARIREEMAAGKSIRNAVDTGFSKAMSAILDGNITTLIAAAVLGVIGTGTVKGFAVTLAIGVILSMFTALIVTRLLINALMALGFRKESHFGKGRVFKKIDIIGKKRTFVGLSLVIIAAGLIGLIGFGIGTGKPLNYSLEFSGGTATTVDFGKDFTLSELESDVQPYFEQVTGDKDIQIQTVQNSTQVIFKTRTLSVDERLELEGLLEENFQIENEAISQQNISSTIGSEMRRSSLIAVVVAAIFMLLYIWFRFKDIRFASSAIAALIHDVLVVLTLYALARISVGSAFIACMLTVIGYSVNDTIVIFDRIRENAKAMTSKTDQDLAELVNTSVNQSMGRTLSTSITTAVMVLMLLVFGVSSIRQFALPLLVGVLCGTYSSVFIAPSLWHLLRTKFRKEA